MYVKFAFMLHSAKIICCGFFFCFLFFFLVKKSIVTQLRQSYGEEINLHVYYMSSAFLNTSDYDLWFVLFCFLTVLT